MALIVLSGPSGVGKNTIADAVLKEILGLKFSRSLTTRTPRETDIPGKYQYVSRDEFQRRVKIGDLLEWAEYNGNLYGTLKPNLSEDTLFEIEIRGASQIKNIYPEAHLIFIVPPGKNIDEQIKVLEERLRKRGADEDKTIKKRLLEARSELEQGAKQSEKIIINDRLEDAINEAVEFIKPLLK
jgi:guanylate kinase